MDTESQIKFKSVIVNRLMEIDDELEGDADSHKAIAPDVAIGRLSRLDSMQMQQVALAARRRLEQERQRLREALTRIDRGTYGQCSLCGTDISEERLTYQPDAQACVDCLDKR